MFILRTLLYINNFFFTGQKKKKFCVYENRDFKFKSLCKNVLVCKKILIVSSSHEFSAKKVCVCILCTIILPFLKCWMVIWFLTFSAFHPFCYLFQHIEINIAMKLQWGLIYYVRLGGTLSLRQYFNKCELILQGQFAWLWNRYNWRRRELQKGWLKGHLVGNNKGEGGGCSEQHYYLICCGSSFRFFFSFFILILIRCKLYKILSFSFSLSLSNI